ncbi:cation-transporting P-type ATPase [Candidatus Woesearchaeota archaeon]|nr:cation-transporting P-type ATPase [Candidatus Woesearchaeota archaeon]
MDLHKLSLSKVFSALETTEKGLSHGEFHDRLTKHGLNRLSERKEKPVWLKFILQFNNFFSYLLLLGATLSFISEWLVPGEGSIYIAWALLVVTLLNAVFTFIQEYKAEQAMKSFRKLMTSTVVVLRDNEKIQIDSRHLVPGDILFLSEGDKVTADCRLIEQASLKVDHSALTGESEPQLRSLKCTSENALLSRNMVFSGTTVQSGSGKAIVGSTGDDTQIGRIAKATEEVEKQTSHLQIQISDFIKVISYIAIFLGVAFFLLGIFVTKNPFWTNLVFAIGIIVANVPEGLLPTVTLTLSLAAKRIAKRNVLVKNMDAIETVGSLTVICSDKTGTLTENNLHVHGFHINNRFYDYDYHKGLISLDGKNAREGYIKGSVDFSDILVLCNNSTYSKDRKFGDPTDICLKEYVSAFHNISYIENIHQRLDEIPFSSETKFMATLNKFRDGKRVYMKGAPEVILSKCDNIFHEGRLLKLSEKRKREILSVNLNYSKAGFRVLGCAIQDASRIVDSGYTFYGLIVMQDPPRKEVPEAVRLCHEAGMKIIVISGDQASTVENIARQVGIVKTSPTIVTGPELIDMSDDELKSILSREELIFARALPADKMRIVSLLQEMGEIVAVTGDGVNDAPALRKANLGIAMGKSGTEVAKEAADIILLDDNFASIVHAIESGRTIYDNIKSFITYILTSNTPEIVPFLFFVLFGWPLALPVLLILAIDLGTDMLPAIGLGLEKSSHDIMKRPPRDPKSKLLNWKMIARSYGFIGPLQTAFAYIVFFHILMSNGWSFGMDIAIRDPVYMTAVAGFFTAVVITQMFNVFACRTQRVSSFHNIFHNKIIWLGILSEIVLLVLFLFTPISTALGISPFPLYYIPWMLLAGFSILLIEEIRKLIFRRFGMFGLE